MQTGNDTKAFRNKIWGALMKPRNGKHGSDHMKHTEPVHPLFLVQGKTF
jgi:hypothetical protein